MVLDRFWMVFGGISSNFIAFGRPRDGVARPFCYGRLELDSLSNRSAVPLERSPGRYGIISIQITASKQLESLEAPRKAPVLERLWWQNLNRKESLKLFEI